MRVSAEAPLPNGWLPPDLIGWYALALACNVILNTKMFLLCHVALWWGDRKCGLFVEPRLGILAVFIQKLLPDSSLRDLHSLSSLIFLWYFILWVEGFWALICTRYSTWLALLMCTGDEGPNPWPLSTPCPLLGGNWRSSSSPWAKLHESPNLQCPAFHLFQSKWAFSSYRGRSRKRLCASGMMSDFKGKKGGAKARFRILSYIDG